MLAVYHVGGMEEFLNVGFARSELNRDAHTSPSMPIFLKILLAASRRTWTSQF